MEFEILKKDNLRQIIKTARCYRETFSTKPWFEVSRGPKCDIFYGSDKPPGMICPCGCGKLEEAYPIVKTTKYIRNEISKPNPIALIISRENKPIAFGWGYVETGNEFANEKYKTKETRKFVEMLVGGEKVYFYLSEFGVTPKERNKGIGKSITREVINEALKLNLPFLMRTNRSSFMDNIARRLDMIPLMGSSNTPSDPENNERILYYKE